MLPAAAVKPVPSRQTKSADSVAVHVWFPYACNCKLVDRSDVPRLHLHRTLNCMLQIII